MSLGNGTLFYAHYDPRIYNQKLTKISVKKLDLFIEKTKETWFNKCNN